MPDDGFSDKAIDALGHYVYRLVDPGNGETFYVGRGRGQRVFDHVRGAINAAEGDESDPKFGRINQIRAKGLEVQQVIHRYGMNRKAAMEVEAALIDAYPGLTNRMGGAGSNDRGVRHVREIIREYDAPEFELDRKLIMISVGKTYEERGVYEAVRSVWNMRKERAEAYDLVLARVGRFIVGAFRVCQWVDWAPRLPEFPFDQEGSLEGRIGFVGTTAEQEVQDRYVRKAGA